VAFRQPGEPASRPAFFAAATSAQTVQTTSNLLIIVIANNEGAAAATLTVADSVGPIGKITIPPNSSEQIFGEPGVSVRGPITVTPSAALDITVVVL
jgi:hypothetical protein